MGMVVCLVLTILSWIMVGSSLDHVFECAHPHRSFREVVFLASPGTLIFLPSGQTLLLKESDVTVQGVTVLKVATSDCC